MIAIENSPQRLVLRSGSTAITLDKGANAATLQRKLLFWERKPVPLPLSSIAEARVETTVDPASRAEICSVMLRSREGGGWVLSARDKQDATAAVAAVREFLSISYGEGRMSQIVGVAMMIAAVAIFVALLPWGGEVRVKSDSAQTFGIMALIVVFILGAVFALKLN